MVEKLSLSGVTVGVVHESKNSQINTKNQGFNPPTVHMFCIHPVSSGSDCPAFTVMALNVAADQCVGIVLYVNNTLMNGTKTLTGNHSANQREPLTEAEVETAH